MKKVLVCTVVLSGVGADPYASHIAFAAKLKSDNPDYQFHFMAPRRMAIDNARNVAVEFALRNNFDYLFFYDDDTDMDPDIFKKLVARDKDAISASYFVRGYPFPLMAFEEVPLDDKEKATLGEGKKWVLMKDWESKVAEDGLLGPLAAIGNGCSLIKIEVFRMLSKPWFKTEEHCTEDVYFYSKASQNIENFEVWMDMNCECGHYLDPIAVNAKNYKVLRECYEKLGYGKEGSQVWTSK